MTLDEFFVHWFKSGTSRASPGWKNDQVEMYRKYVHPLLGGLRLDQIRPVEIANVLEAAKNLGRSPQMRLHIYNLLHKLFGDAVEMFEVLGRSPVKKALHPVVPRNETPYLKVEEAVILLKHVRDRAFELAIWLNLYVGMRAGEIQALLWKNVDLTEGVIHIRATYVRKERRIQDHPKGKEWHSVQAPPELLEMLRQASIGRGPEDFVVESPRRAMLSYGGYYKALKRYCIEVGVPSIATHGLRHSTSGIYFAHGATRDDLYRLFKHSSPAVTERYIHNDAGRIGEVARVIRLFPESGDCKKVERISSSKESV